MEVSIGSHVKRQPPKSLGNYRDFRQQLHHLIEPYFDQLSAADSPTHPGYRLLLHVSTSIR